MSQWSESPVVRTSILQVKLQNPNSVRPISGPWDEDTEDMVFPSKLSSKRVGVSGIEDTLIFAQNCNEPHELDKSTSQTPSAINTCAHIPMWGRMTPSLGMNGPYFHPAMFPWCFLMLYLPHVFPPALNLYTRSFSNLEGNETIYKLSKVHQ